MERFHVHLSQRQHDEALLPQDMINEIMSHLADIYWTTWKEAMKCVVAEYHHRVSYRGERTCFDRHIHGPNRSVMFNWRNLHHRTYWQRGGDDDYIFDLTHRRVFGKARLPNNY